MFRVALLSRWHVHSHKNDQRYVKEFLSQPDCAVTCVWDRNEGIAREWAEEYGVPYSTDLETVISREDVDGVIVTSAVNEHKEIYSLAAKYKKHILSASLFCRCKMLWEEIPRLPDKTIKMIKLLRSIGDYDNF